MKNLFKRLCTKKKDLYLCGAISNDPDYKEKFMKTQRALEKAGYKVSNPVIFCGKETDWNKCMRKCLRVLSRKKYLAYIDDEIASHGRDLEKNIAHELGLTVKSADRWIKAAKKNERRI